MRLTSLQSSPGFQTPSDFRNTPTIFWNSLLNSYGKPISESANQSKLNELHTLLFAHAIRLNEKQRELFFKNLLAPNNTRIDEGVVDWVQKQATKVTDLMVSIQDKIDSEKKKIAGKVIKGASELFNKYVPDSVKQLGADIVKKVKSQIAWVLEKSGDALKKLSAKFNEIGALDTCSNNPNLQESIANSISTLITDPAVWEFISKKNDSVSQAAFIVAYLKYNSQVILGSHLLPILQDLVERFGDGDLDVFIETSPDEEMMAKWVGDNNFIQQIAAQTIEVEQNFPDKIDLSGTPPVPPCNPSPGLLDSFFGPDSAFGKTCDKLGLTGDGNIAGILKELNSNKVSTLITIGSLFLSFSSGVGAARIVGLVFASVIPLFISTHIKYLETNNASAESIEFWKKARSLSKFINTILQLFNIADLVKNGWSAFANPTKVTPNDDLGLSPNEELVPSTPRESTFIENNLSFTSLSPDAQNSIMQIVDSGKVDDTTMHTYFTKIVKQMDKEQFAQLQQMALSDDSEVKDTLAKYITKSVELEYPFFGEDVSTPYEDTEIETTAEHDSGIASPSPKNVLLTNTFSDEFMEKLPPVLQVEFTVDKYNLDATHKLIQSKLEAADVLGEEARSKITEIEANFDRYDLAGQDPKKLIAEQEEILKFVDSVETDAQYMRGFIRIFESADDDVHGAESLLSNKVITLIQDTTKQNNASGHFLQEYMGGENNELTKLAELKNKLGAMIIAPKPEYRDEIVRLQEELRLSVVNVTGKMEELSGVGSTFRVNLLDGSHNYQMDSLVDEIYPGLNPVDSSDKMATLTTLFSSDNQKVTNIVDSALSKYISGELNKQGLRAALKAATEEYNSPILTH